MPLKGFDDASKNINKKRKERKRGFPGLQGATEAIGNFVGAIPDTLLYQRRQAKARGEAAAKAKQAKKPATTQESLLNIKNEYVGFNPFKEANKSDTITKTVVTRPKVEVKTTTPKEAKVKATTTKTKVPTTKTKVPAAKAPKAANTGFTSAVDRIKNKGVSNLKPTPSKTKKGSYNFTEGTGPNTSVFDKTKNVAPKTEEKAYQKKGTMGKGKAPRINAKPKKRAAKGSRAATLKKGFGY